MKVSEYERVKRRMYEILSGIKSEDRTSIIVNYTIIGFIVLSVISVMIESVEGLSYRYRNTFDVLEVVCIVVFSIEYLLRIWSCTVSSSYRGNIIGRVRYVLTFMALVDLIAILPFYVPVLIGADLRFVRILRVFRLFRLAKLIRYTNALWQMKKVFRAKREHLIITLAAIAIVVVFVSGIMYYVEHDAQPEKYSSIPETMWWAICTMTTVGYGDVFPITTLGKILAGIVSILGLCLFAVPAGIISAGFIELTLKKSDTEASESEK
jgi:voltage-gated potassium channel